MVTILMCKIMEVRHFQVLTMPEIPVPNRVTCRYFINVSMKANYYLDGQMICGSMRICRRTREDIRRSRYLDEKVRHLEESAAAGEGQRRLLGLLGLGIDVGPLAKQEGHHLLVALAAGLHQRGVALVVHLTRRTTMSSLLLKVYTGNCELHDRIYRY